MPSIRPPVTSFSSLEPFTAEQRRRGATFLSGAAEATLGRRSRIQAIMLQEVERKRQEEAQKKAEKEKRKGLFGGLIGGAAGAVAAPFTGGTSLSAIFGMASTGASLGQGIATGNLDVPSTLGHLANVPGLATWDDLDAGFESSFSQREYGTELYGTPEY